MLSSLCLLYYSSHNSRGKDCSNKPKRDLNSEANNANTENE